MNTTIASERNDHIIAWFAALAIAIHVLESAIPSPVPGIKIGLANVVTIVVLVQFGWRTAAWVSILRVLVGSLIIGSFLSPTFVLSLSGACASLIAIGLAYAIARQHLSALGYSVIAAVAHILAQFWTAYLLFIPHDALFHLLPILTTVAIVTGIVNGSLALAVQKRLKLLMSEAPNVDQQP
ncbi:MAG: heptaprenyl diphosphate synthase [Gammaproteobacteria bacterium]|nr:Gx transporter family protein [Gammaproteobacteria bacterium]PCH63855.1 MAG: heptaprenyl diphosphate synthase [Gammaproteobacteria bacterium]